MGFDAHICWDVQSGSEGDGRVQARGEPSSDS